MRNLIILFNVLTFTSHVSANIEMHHKNIENTDALQSKNSLQKSIYTFQHKLLPKWTFESNGSFFDDLMSGRISTLHKTAIEMISSDYAKSISVHRFKQKNGILLVFQKPYDIPNCFFIFIRKIKNQFHFFTYEKSANVKDSDGKVAVGVLGYWLQSGWHGNYGFRDYSDSESFANEAVQLSSEFK